MSTQAAALVLASGQELGPQGNEHLHGAGDIQGNSVHDEGSLDLLAAYWIENVFI